MKLLMTTDTIGGVWTYSVQLASALTSADVDIILACTGDPLSPEQSAQAQNLKGTTVVQRACKLEWMDDPWQDVTATGRWLLALRDEFKPDVVHLNEFAHGMLPWQCPTLLVAHSCIASWWQAVKGRPAPARFARYIETVRASLEQVDAIVAPSKAMAESLVFHYQPRKPVNIIANGRSSDRICTGKKHPLVFSAGRMWDDAKNLAALDQAAVDLPWRVYIAGPTTHDNSTAQSARNSHLLGPLPPHKVLAWMARADIYALPARYEPFGLSVLEAARSGCCLLLGDIESLRENWHGAAVFVDPEDPTAIHTELQQLIRNPAKRRALAEAARMRSRTFTPQRMAQRYLQLYQQMQWAVPAASS